MTKMENINRLNKVMKFIYICHSNVHLRWLNYLRILNRIWFPFNEFSICIRFFIIFWLEGSGLNWLNCLLFYFFEDIFIIDVPDCWKVYETISPLFNINHKLNKFLLTFFFCSVVICQLTESYWKNCFLYFRYYVVTFICNLVPNLILFVW